MQRNHCKRSLVKWTLNKEIFSKAMILSLVSRESKSIGSVSNRKRRKKNVFIKSRLLAMVSFCYTLRTN